MNEGNKAIPWLKPAEIDPETPDIYEFYGIDREEVPNIAPQKVIIPMFKIIEEEKARKKASKKRKRIRVKIHRNEANTRNNNTQIDPKGISSDEILDYIASKHKPISVIEGLIHEGMIKNELHPFAAVRLVNKPKIKKKYLTKRRLAEKKIKNKDAHDVTYVPSFWSPRPWDKKENHIISKKLEKQMNEWNDEYVASFNSFIAEDLPPAKVPIDYGRETISLPL